MQQRLALHRAANPTTRRHFAALPCPALMAVFVNIAAMGQMGLATPLPPAEQQKAAAEREAAGAIANYSQLVDITASTGIKISSTAAQTANSKRLQ